MMVPVFVLVSSVGAVYLLMATILMKFVVLSLFLCSWKVLQVQVSCTAETRPDTIETCNCPNCKNRAGNPA